VFVFSDEFIAWLASRPFASPASSVSQRNRSFRTKQTESLHTKINFFYQTVGELRTPFEQSWSAYGNSTDSELGRTRDEASREDQDTEHRQSFPIGSIDSTVGESSQSKDSWPLAPVQEILSRGLQLFDE